ncbi:hypothetical protein [Spiroplasma floricola]|uniref:Cell division protein FtsA n=1 Tax=Spiroplasma floricola 23-6 TaxID=1336749 RepID=A0A2K8SF62_9MOLU|nr:hypothetical protein [Spiroplasma floricola]AUB31878.1 cell division protein FtsA [Spiroplasma floricola 23-6]
MYNETYAAIEISKKYIKFVVGKYKQHIGLKIVFKEREKSKGNWLTENNDIVDTNLVAHRLIKMINKYESMYKEKIRRVSVIYPTGTLQIKEASPSIFIETPDKVIRSEHIRTLYKNAKKVIFNDNQIVTNIKPYEFRINNSHSVAKPPVNIKANLLSMNAKVYTAEKHVVDSFDRVLKTLNIEKLTVASQLYSLAKQCNDGLNFRHTFALINWDWDCVDIGYFSRETLVKKETLSFGIKHIIENLANKMAAKFDISNKYIFKLLNFSSTTLDNIVIYRKYIASEKRTYELKTIDIKKLLLEELNSVIDKVDVLIEREMSAVKNFKVYHTGKITEIAGFEKILLRSKHKNISEAYYSLITGASEIWTTALCGIIKHSRAINKNQKEIRTSTEIYHLPFMDNPNQVQNHPRMQGMPMPQNRAMTQQEYMMQNQQKVYQQNQQMNQQLNQQMLIQQNYQNNENF